MANTEPDIKADINAARDRGETVSLMEPLLIGVVTSKSTRAPLRLAFPAALAARWMPGLFPEGAA
ncbi:MAG TPA: hypothetical protein VH684_07375 [Xanthobacteraceae bacterium]|jgi:hypothetical protein